MLSDKYPVLVKDKIFRTQKHLQVQMGLFAAISKEGNLPRELL